ncbi:50S ribosomal protein L22 [Candidatus Giovannonibacteria bacterium]|nr:50S ribosomal protein L22 [Candidatus Giovannonibacteria bacterium]
MTQVRAELRYLRMSARKVRQVADLIRGQSVKKAGETLKFAAKTSGAPLQKLLKSARADARHNFGLDPETLVVKEIRVDEGPTLKRFMPRAFGRSAPIRKRMSHITLVLADKK